MNTNAIIAPAHVTLSLLVQYTRERRSAERGYSGAVEGSTARLHNDAYNRLSEAMNGLAIMALRAGYDMDMLAWLVQGTTDRQLETLACDARVNDEVIALIATMRTPKEPAKPKAPKAPKAFAPKLGTDYAEIVTYLRSATSRQDAAEILKGLTVAELNHVWSLTGREDKIPSKLVKADRVAHMIESLVGYRLDSEAIRTAR